VSNSNQNESFSNRFQHNCYLILNNHQIEKSHLPKWLVLSDDVFIPILILANMALSITGNNALAFFFQGFFFVELVLKCYAFSANNRTKKQFFTTEFLIDAIAVLGGFIFLTGWISVNVNTINCLRFLRIIRYLQLGFEGLTINQIKTVTFFALLQPAFIAVFGYLERDQNLSTIDLIYFCVITSATVGFGDINPATQEGKIVTMIYVVLSTYYLVQVIQIFFAPPTVSVVDDEK
jgi:hypothetical protein